MLGISKTLPEQVELERALKSGIKGEVYVDPMMRGLYATDASIYQQDPAAVVVAVDAEDVAHAMKTAREKRIPILMRGGGTSLAGQATGRSVIIDTSKNMNRVLEVNTAERWLRVQPGRVRDELNGEIVATGLHFAPETATSNRANVGGMIANNSSGAKSIVYGKTIDHVIELELLLATGERLRARPMCRAEWDEIAKQDTREGQIYKTIRDAVESNRDEIEKRYPKVMRRVGGYNLDAFPADGPWNLAKIVIGSEGTLAAILEAKVNLEPIPKAKCLLAVHFRNLAESLRAARAIVPFGPSAVELLDRIIIEMARGNLEARRLCDWMEGDPQAILAVEFFGDSAKDAEAKIDKLLAHLRSVGYGYAHVKLLDSASQAKLWGVRASGLGLMLGIKGDAKPMPFIEDAAVPVEVLPDYIEEVVKLCESRGVNVAMYAHASVGLIHVRPILNLKSAPDIQNMKYISEKTFELVQKYGGSWSGEHGDGLVRSYMNERFFGPKLYAAFKEIKKAFDPDWLMNPGKIVEAPPMDQDLRMGPQYRVQPMKTQYYYRADGGFGRAVEMCTGVGACRKTLGGTMCPSYMATRDEIHTTRGRANALRLAMTGQLGSDGMTSRAMYEVFDLCLGCKGCKAECPSNVDVAKLKNEFLFAYHEKHGSTRAERFFASGPKMGARFAGRWAGIANWANRNTTIRALMERFMGVDRRRPMPALTSDPFPKWFARRRIPFPKPGDPPRRRVVLFDDSYINNHDPHIGKAAVRLLEALGYEVQLAHAGCCGRPLISMGFLEEAKRMGLATLNKLNGFLTAGTPVVGCEPSCVSALTDDLPDLIENHTLGQRIASGVKMIDVFLQEEIESGNLSAERLKAVKEASAAPVLIHGHCHQKALYGTTAMKKLFAAAGCEKVAEVDSGCCGMAGSFGYEKEHYDLSMKIGGSRLFPAVKKAEPGTRVVACGFSCRHQIADGAQVAAKHWVEVMADLIAPEINK